MNVRRFLGRVLAVFAIVGLVSAPLVTPAAAKRSAVASAVDMAAMSGDMPCCQADMKDSMNGCSEQQKGNDCRDCPVMAICTLTLAQAEPPPANDIPAPVLSTRGFFFAIEDLIADSLIGSPPDHPPRISI